MVHKSGKRTQPSRQTVWLAFGLLGLWMLVVYTGMRLPYLYSGLAFSVRTFLLFPLLLGLLVYFAMVHRWPNRPNTLYAMRMSLLRNKHEKIKGVALTIFGFLLIAGGLAWTSVAFPAWTTQLMASEHYAHVYRIADITVKSGAKWSTLFDLEMIDSAGEEVTLRLGRSRYEKNHWRSGEDICVIGRTWMFGTIIDDASRYLERCDK